MKIIKINDKYCVRELSLKALLYKFTPYVYAKIRNVHEGTNTREDALSYNPCWETKKNLTNDYYGDYADALMAKFSLNIQSLQYWQEQCGYPKYKKPDPWYYNI